jgi:methylmalonyl-CoA decarboxylase subunit alpha
MFVTGPKVVKTVTGEDISIEDLGGGKIHATKSGVSHFLVEDEKEGLMLIRKLLTFLPQNNLEDPIITENTDPIDRMEDFLNEIIPENPNQPYDILDVITSIVDYAEFLEIHRNYAKNIVTGFAKFDGQPVGIVANQPNYLAGVLDIEASRKAARFVRFATVSTFLLLPLSMFRVSCQVADRSMEALSFMGQNFFLPMVKPPFRKSQLPLENHMAVLTM